MMNVRVLYAKEPQIRMPSVRSSQPTDKPRKSSPPKDAKSKSIQPKVSSPKGVQTKSPLLKSSPPKKETAVHNKPYNSNVCFLCGKAGHYGNQSSCHAANKVRKAYFN
jgi:hypothetical protein